MIQFEHTSADSAPEKIEDFSLNTASDIELPPPIFSPLVCKDFTDSWNCTEMKTAVSSGASSSSIRKIVPSLLPVPTLNHSILSGEHVERNLEQELNQLHQEMEKIQVECDMLIEQQAQAEKKMHRQLSLADQLTSMVDMHLKTKQAKKTFSGIKLGTLDLGTRGAKVYGVKNNSSSAYSSGTSDSQKSFSPPAIESPYEVLEDSATGERASTVFTRAENSVENLGVSSCDQKSVGVSLSQPEVLNLFESESCFMAQCSAARAAVESRRRKRGRGK